MKSGELLQKLKNEILIFDGGFGTELYRRNFFINTSYDYLCITASSVVLAIHQAYVDAGAEVLTTNTYSANPLKLAQFGLADQTENINKAAVDLAKKAAAGNPHILIAGSIGPLPHDTADEEAVNALQRQVSAQIQAGIDFLIFESISNLPDLQWVIRAIRDQNTAWIPSFVFNQDGVLADGSGIDEILQTLQQASVPVEAVGLNCGTGPDDTLTALQKIIGKIPVPVIVQPGAGTPRNIDNRFMPMASPEYFTTYCIRYTNLGARAVGGCCGISPEHIADLVRSLKPLVKAEHAAVPKLEVNEEELLPPVPLEERSSFGKKLKEKKWLKLLEMTPPAGFDLTQTVEKAIQCKAAGFDAINIPDGPRASSRISQVITAIDIQEKAGIETIIHCCCRDRNLINLQSMILGCMAKKLNNILFITGDPPKLGDYPFSSGVFDVDSIGLVRLQSRLNRGLDIAGKKLGKGEQTAIVSGVGVDPNAIDPEREYRRLAEKIEAGADFIITQPVFDPDILLTFLKKIKHFNCPVIAGIWPLISYRNAEFMQKEVPGVVVPEWIMDAMKNAGDKAEQRLEGIRIARTILAAIHSEVQGIATSAPFGNIDTAIEVCKGY